MVSHFRISTYESIFTGTFWGSTQHEAFRSCAIQADTAGKEIVGLASLDKDSMSTAQCFFVAFSHHCDGDDVSKIPLLFRTVMPSNNNYDSADSDHKQYIQGEGSINAYDGLDLRDTKSS
jgi:hypothetical protein